MDESVCAIAPARDAGGFLAYPASEVRDRGESKQANGDVIVWIIGIDEQTGQVHPVAEDVESWWPHVVAEFDDGVFPTVLLRSMVFAHRVDLIGG